MPLHQRVFSFSRPQLVVAGDYIYEAYALEIAKLCRILRLGNQRVFMMLILLLLVKAFKHSIKITDFTTLLKHF